jgi:hypothetical protein
MTRTDPVYNSLSISFETIEEEIQALQNSPEYQQRFEEISKNKNLREKYLVKEDSPER